MYCLLFEPAEDEEGEDTEYRSQLPEHVHYNISANYTAEFPDFTEYEGYRNMTWQNYTHQYRYASSILPFICI